MARLVQRVWQACGVVLLGSMASCKTLAGPDELERANGGASGSDGEGGSAESSGGVESGGASGSPESAGDWWGTGGQGGEDGWNWGGTGNAGVAGAGGHATEIGGSAGEAGEGSELGGYGGRGTAGGGSSGAGDAGADGSSAGSGGAGGIGAGTGGTDTGGMGAGGNPTGGIGSGGVGTGGELSAGGSGGSATGGEAGTSATGGSTAVGTGGQCGETECGAECVDVMEDVFHCGECGRACEADGVSDWRCDGGLCTSTCLAGRGNCSQPIAPQPDDGCETNILNDVLNCGECGRACVTPGGVDQARCDAGVCTSTCLPGYVNANRPGAPSADDGCELNTMTDVNNCGAQGRACDGTHVSELSCAGGVCTSTCETGYWNENRPETGEDDGCESLCPSTPGAGRMVRLPGGYCIDETEVTQGQYAEWLNATPSTAGQDAWCAWNDSYVPTGDWGDGGRANYPVAYVDWCDAYAYCRGVGKRLCGNREGGPNGYGDSADASESQWYNACVSGAAGNEYPYGDTYGSTLCNGYDYTGSGTVEVGTIGSCQSSVEGYEGVYDLSGNVFEWEDSCNAWSGQSDNCHPRGGSFSSYDVLLRCGGANVRPRDDRDGSVGFRCCAP